MKQEQKKKEIKIEENITCKAGKPVIYFLDLLHQIRMYRLESIYAINNSFFMFVCFLLLQRKQLM